MYKFLNTYKNENSVLPKANTPLNYIISYFAKNST